MINLGYFEESIILYEQGLDINPKNTLLNRNLEKAKIDYGNFDSQRVDDDSNFDESKSNNAKNKNNSNNNSSGFFNDVLSSLEGFFSLFS